MDVDFLASRVQSVKHLSAMQASRLNSETNICLDDFEADDDMGACFPCPFCNVDIEVAALRAHLQEEHCFDVKNAVCPVCAENLGRDIIAHFSMQHSHLLKRRRKSQRTGLWNSAAFLGKEHQELNFFFGDGPASISGRTNTTDSMPDPLLSPFLCGLSLTDARNNNDTSSGIDSTVASASSDVLSTEPFKSNRDQEQDDEERRHRAEFIQQLVLSTVF